MVCVQNTYNRDTTATGTLHLEISIVGFVIGFK